MKYVAILCSILMLSACDTPQQIKKPITTENITSTYQIDMSITQEPIDVTPWFSFLSQCEQKKNTDILIIQYTDEGDPIYLHVSYESVADLYRLHYDASKDRYGTKDRILDQTYHYLLSIKDTSFNVGMTPSDIVITDVQEWYLSNTQSLPDSNILKNSTLNDSFYLLTTIVSHMK